MLYLSNRGKRVFLGGIFLKQGSGKGDLFNHNERVGSEEKYDGRGRKDYPWEDK